MMKERAFLKIDHVDKSFTRGAATTEVLRDISLVIAKGEYVSIIGHSGCGKSTLLNLVAGLTPVTRGAILLEDQEVNAPGPDRAVVFQNHSLLPWLTVYDNVRLAVDKVSGATRAKAERHDWTMHNLELVHMAHDKDKRTAYVVRDGAETALEDYATQEWAEFLPALKQSQEKPIAHGPIDINANNRGGGNGTYLSDDDRKRATELARRTF